MTALPDLPGPKLRPFHSTETKPKIDFIEHIATGADATIWKVSIDGDVYALKIVIIACILHHCIKAYADVGGLAVLLRGQRRPLYPTFS